MTDGFLVLVVGLSLLLSMGLLAVLVVAFPTAEELDHFLRKHHIPPRRH